MKSFDVTVRGFGARYFDIVVSDLPIHEAIRVSDKWYLIESPIHLDKEGHLSLMPNTLYLGAYVDAVETSFIKPTDVLYLKEALSEPHLEYNVGIDDNKMTLTESAVHLYNGKYLGEIDDNMYLFNSPISLDAERTLHLINIMYLNDDVASVHAVKSIDGGDDLSLGENVDISAEKHIAATDTLYMSSSSVGTEMRVWRTLGMMDDNGTSDYTLADFDSAKLVNLDYITI